MLYLICVHCGNPKISGEIKKMDAMCCCCNKSTRCYYQKHPKIKKIKKIYHKLYGSIPYGQESLIFCGLCGDRILDELELELNAIKCHKKRIQIPKNLKVNLKNKSFTCVEVPKGHPEYAMIQNRFNESLENTIIRIEKVHNPKLLNQFVKRQTELNDYKVKYLFHGSGNQNYDKIFQNGFSISRAKDTGALGAGIYFALDSSYSHSYTRNISTLEKGQIRNMLCARVIFGKIGRGKNTRSGANTWAVFSEGQCYPEYIIYYLV